MAMTMWRRRTKKNHNYDNRSNNVSSCLLLLFHRPLSGLAFGFLGTGPCWTWDNNGLWWKGIFLPWSSPQWNHNNDNNSRVHGQLDNTWSKCGNTKRTTAITTAATIRNDDDDHHRAWHEPWPEIIFAPPGRVAYSS